MISTAVFLGSKKFGLEIFRSIYHAEENISWTVLCPPDEGDIRSNVEEFRSFAATENIDFVIAKSPQKVLQIARGLLPDVMIVCGYYRLLPDAIFQVVRDGVWGIHNSLLPQYRGGSPLVWQIINGEKTVGSSFFRFASGIDDGPVLEQVRLEDAQTLTIKDAMDSLEHAWIKRLPVIWQGFCEGSIEAKEQNHSEATYCALRNEHDGEIDWHKDALDIDRFVRAQASPYPGAFFTLNDKKIKVVKHELDARVIYGTVGQVFEIGKDHVTVCCGQNSGLRLFELDVDGTVVAAVSVLNSIKLRI
jgi:methionyl-tRNA formyltransferase